MGGIHKKMNAARDKNINSENSKRINLCSSKTNTHNERHERPGVWANGLNIERIHARNRNVQNDWRHVRNAMRARPICKV